MRKIIAALLLALLVGCGKVEKTHIAHIQEAMALCAVNGGLKEISGPSYERGTEDCGYRCVRRTDAIHFKGEATCVNGATFKLKVSRKVSNEQ